MGLDATVYCDCLERGRLQTAPRPEWNVHVDAYGGRSATTGSLESDLEFDRWNTSACEHEAGVLLHKYLGNIDGIATVRAALSTDPGRFPLLLQKVVYSGTHCGDMLSVDYFPKLASELVLLRHFAVDSADNSERVHLFQSQLGRLLEVATAVGKPIAF